MLYESFVHFLGKNPSDGKSSSKSRSYGPFHFLTLFLVVGGVIVVAYVCMHNRKKVCVHVHLCLSRLIVVIHTTRLYVGQKTRQVFYICFQLEEGVSI